MAWRVGVDIGGTFTDVALVDEASGRIGVAKVPTTPGDLTQGVLSALKLAMNRYRVAATDVGLLSLTLISPAGTRIPLAETRGFLGPNYDDTIFDDEAAQSINEGSPPYAGSYRPASPLSVLDSTSALGAWKLEVYDLWFDPGTLNSWSLIVTPRAFVCALGTGNPNVSGTKTVSGTFSVGGTVTYTVTLTNNGTLGALDLAGPEFTDTLPAIVEERRLAGAPPTLLADPPRIRASSPRTRAALGYLAANCGGCHNASGEISANVPSLAYADVMAGADAVADSLVGRATRFQVPGVAEGASVVVDPLAPAQSALLCRMRTRRPSAQMPPLGTVVIDTQALDAIAEWIATDLAQRSTASAAPPPPHN